MTRTLLMLGGIPWRDEVNHTSIQMARAFARLGHHVVYATRPRQSSIIRGVEGRRPRAQMPHTAFRANAGPGVVEILALDGINELLPLSSPEPLRRLQMSVVHRKIANHPAVLSQQVDATILYWWFFPELIGVLPGAVIYDALDEHHAYASNRRRHRYNVRSRQLEADTARRVMATACVSSALADRLRTFSSRTYHLPNCVDVTLVRQLAARCQDRRNERPIVGYTGGLGERIDWLALARLWQACPDYDFVFVGGGGRPPAYPYNVKFLGAAPYSEMVCHIRSFDVALIPFVTSDFARASDFLKAYDYLAVGTPFVAPRLPAIERLARFFPMHIAIVEPGRDWAPMVDAVVRARAYGHSPAPDLSQHDTSARARALLSLMSMDGSAPDPTGDQEKGQPPHQL